MTDLGEVVLIEAARADIALVNDMARFYLYDIARQIGPRDEWVASLDWMRERKDLSGAWDEGNHPFLIEVGGALAGFCLVDRYALVPDIDWNMSQFFVMGPWAGHGVGRRAAVAAFDRFRGPLAGDAGSGEQGSRPVLAPRHRHPHKGRLRGAAAPGARAWQRPPQRDDLHRSGSTDALKTRRVSNQRSLRLIQRFCRQRIR